MRFAENWRLGLVVALGASGAGCMSITDPPSALGPKVIASVASPAPSAASAAASAPAALETEPQTPLLPVDPAVQRAFDDARRALAAGQVQQAERGFLALTRSNPELGGPHADLGLIYRQAGKLPEAVAELEQAVRSSPQQAVYLNQLGVAYRQQGQFDKAHEAYEKAIALAPDYAAATLNLGILHDLYLGDGKRALELYDRYLSLSPGGDAMVSKWLVDLNNRKPQTLAASRKEKQ